MLWSKTELAEGCGPEALGTPAQWRGGVAGIEGGSLGQSLSQAAASAGLVDRSIKIWLCCLMHHPGSQAQSRSDSAGRGCSGQVGSKGLAGCVPEGRRGRHGGDRPCLGLEERMGCAVGHHPIDLYCLLPPCSFLLQLPPLLQDHLSPPFCFFPSFFPLPVSSFNDDFCRDLYQRLHGLVNL